MAARRTSSGAEGLVLYDADEWRNKVHLYDRDCLFSEMDQLPSASAQSPHYLPPDTGYYPLNRADAEVVRGDDILGGSVHQSRYDASSTGCRQSRASKSIVGVDALPAYSGGRYRSISLPGQPFSFAGDTTLTTVRSPDGSYSIRVDRLYGDQSNEYTMVNVLKEFPTAPPFATPQMGAMRSEQVDALPVPYAFNDEAGIRHPSVSSQSAVYFAVNPSSAMLEGFQRWCSATDEDPLGVLQLQVLSSYGGVRLWRIEPFTYCPVGDDGRPGCGPGHVRFVDLPSPMLGAGVDSPNDATGCLREFTVKVTSLEYLNSDNVAVTYLSIRLVDYSIRTATPMPGRGSFRTLYYNPRRNALRETPWHKEVGVTATAEGRLCPAMRRFPAVGSLLMEGATVGVNLLRFFLRLTLSLPGAVHMWMSGRRCPAVSYGHTLVETGCGADLFSLSEVWESTDRASGHFWRAFSIVAASIGDTGLVGSSQAANIVEGAAMVGQSSALPFVGGFYSVARSMRLPIVGTSNTILKAAFSSGPGKGSGLPALGLAALAPNPLKVAQFSYELVAGWVARLLPLAMRGGKPSELVLEALHITRDSIVDSRGDFDRLVLSTMLQGCSGLSLMLGFSNPWALYIRRQCETVPHAVNGTLSVLLLTTAVIPFVQCMCVPAAGFVESFEGHVMRRCYRMSPEYLRGFTLGVVDRVRRGGTPGAACQAMVDLAKAEMSNSMQPWFDAQFMAAQALGPSVSYLADYFDPQGAMCGDSEKNPFSAVLIPEPYDFWGACGATSLCKTKCFFPEQVFEQEVARLGLLASQGAQQTVSRTVESRFFEGLDSDTLAPLSVLAMVQLQDCSRACSSGADDDAGDLLGNRDSCVAVAGVGRDSMDIAIHQYCVPVRMGLAVYRNEALSWAIHDSHGFLSTVVDVFFSDTVSGETVLLFRDNSGTGMEGPPAEFVTVHNRGMYSSDPMLQEAFGAPPDEVIRHLLVTQIDDYAALVPDGSEVCVARPILLPRCRAPTAHT